MNHATQSALAQAEELVARLCRAVPPGQAITAKRKVSDDPLDAHTSFELRPLRARAAPLRIIVYDNFRTVELAAGGSASFVFEDLTTDNALVSAFERIFTLASGVIGGRLVETLREVDGRVVSTTAEISGDPAAVSTHVFGRINERTTVKTLRYEPYWDPEGEQS